MQTRSNIKPPELEVEKCTNLAVVICRENIQEEVGPEGETLYSYDEYRTLTTWRDSLEASAKEHAQEWLETGKQMEYDQVASDVRERRDDLLRQSDKQLCLDRLGLGASSAFSSEDVLAFLRSLWAAITGEWAHYRQALRDIPQQEGFPYDVTWPVEPSGEIEEEVQAAEAEQEKELNEPEQTSSEESIEPGQSESQEEVAGEETTQPETDGDENSGEESQETEGETA